MKLEEKLENLKKQLKQIETAWAKTLGAIELVEQLIKEQNSEEEDKE
tara:strand:- start:86 stop:226 length:141 start_codon:yes stop_codon:yes gene_type:complete